MHFRTNLGGTLIQATGSPGMNLPPSRGELSGLPRGPAPSGLEQLSVSCLVDGAGIPCLSSEELLTPYYSTDRKLSYGETTIMNSLKTGELAREAGVNVETLRFYERKGLLPTPPRRVSGYRDYPPESVGRIRFIKRSQELGFSLREIQGLLDLRVKPGTTCGQVRQRAEQKVLEIEEKITDLKAIQQALRNLIGTCSGRGPARQCPILDHLNQKEA